MNFPQAKCPKCGKTSEMMVTNNPVAIPVCFDCIKSELNYMDLRHADYFCRTYNLPFKPDTWILLTEKCGDNVFREYARIFFEDRTQQNLFYEGVTKDLWDLANHEWEKCRTQTQLMNKIPPIRDSYIERSRIKWGGAEYSFEELVKMDSLYTSTLRANNITNPLQKEAVKMLCKLHIELNQAILQGDTKAVKDYTNAYSNFAKEAGLDTMVEESKTDDITTVAELYDFMEKEGFQFKFYQGDEKDEVDKTLKDIKESTSRLVLESTGIGTLLEDMAKKRERKREEEQTQQAVEETSLADMQALMDYNCDDVEIETEDDDLITSGQFTEEEE